MPTLIISLVPYSAVFRNSIIHYCQVTGNPSTPEVHKEMFHQCLSQICSKMDLNAHEFMYNLMELPQWNMIHYLDTPIDYEATKFFAEEFRIFALAFRDTLQKHVSDHEKYTFILESCSISMAVVSIYLEAGFG